jgi:hypothetical protein
VQAVCGVSPEIPRKKRGIAFFETENISVFFRERHRRRKRGRDIPERYGGKDFPWRRTA